MREERPYLTFANPCDQLLCQSPTPTERQHLPRASPVLAPGWPPDRQTAFGGVISSPKRALVAILSQKAQSRSRATFSRTYTAIS